MTQFIPRCASALIKADELAYLRLTRRDLARAVRFFTDFGLQVTARTERAVYLRGCLPQHHCVIVEQGEHDGFAALGIHALNRADLDTLAAAFGTSVDSIEEPGGGQIVRLRDPSGFPVEVVHGTEELPALPQRAARVQNQPLHKARVNAPQPILLGPAEVYRLGHAVMTRQEFAKNANWYVETLGLIASDVEVLPGSREPVLAFMRFDRGATPSDHHNIVIAAGPEDGYAHSAFETLDIDSLGAGAEWLQYQGWIKAWGIGRHVLGSQLFCYHYDSSGFEVEHYIDGDVFDADYPTRYHPAGTCGLYLWGPDLPEQFIDLAMTPKRIANIVSGLRHRADFSLSRLLALKNAYTAKARPWIGKTLRKPTAH